MSEQREPMRIEIVTPEKFENLQATTIETTQRLAKRINAVFSSAFVDFYGTVITANVGNGNVAPNQQFNVEIHFKPLAAGSVNSNDGRIRAFRPIEETTATADIVSNLKSIYGAFRTSAKFEITPEAAELLSEFMPNTVDPFKPSTYAPFKAEYVDNAMYGQGPIMIKVSGLDLLRLIRKIYGNKNAAGRKVEYAVIPHGPVTIGGYNNQIVQGGANWKVILMQIDAAKTFDLAAEAGLIAGNGGVGTVVTGTL